MKTRLATFGILFATTAVACVQVLGLDDPISVPDGGTARPDGTAPRPDGTAPPGPVTPAGCQPPAGNTCRTSPQQCGCGAGQNCVLNLSAATECVTEGTSTLNEACAGDTQCAAGFGCLNAVCTPFCGTANDCPVPATCVVVNPLNPGVTACAPRCDLLDPAAGCGDATCNVLVAATGASATYCAAAGGTVQYGPCEGQPLTCAQRHVCIQGQCRQWCRVGITGDCAFGDCLVPSQPITVDGVDYGVCP